MRTNLKIMLMNSHKFTFQHKNVNNRYMQMVLPGSTYLYYTIITIYWLSRSQLKYLFRSLSPIIKEIIEIVTIADNIQKYIARRSDYLLITTSAKRLTFSNNPREKNLPKRVSWPNPELILNYSIICSTCI